MTAKTGTSKSGAAKPGKPRFGQLGRDQPLHKKVATLISKEIVNGQFLPGDKLPSEHELAQIFEVSRNVVREAIACLRSDGVVISRQGLGAFVVQPELRQAIRIDAEELQQSGNLRSLFELRSALEIEAAGLAAKRRTKPQLARIEQALSKMTGAEKMLDAGIDADLDFHRAVAEAAGNEYLVTFLTYLGHQMRETILTVRETHGLETVVELTIAEHQRIFEALTAGDPDAARNAMRDHIGAAAQRLNIEL
ncbi:MAG: FadR family transcriptional regulator [Alphaproteobacteria bacterium]|nr:FadR family transcriptional regulator [Alphaproteobacteria bacterium]